MFQLKLDNNKSKNNGKKYEIEEIFDNVIYFKEINI